jgi:glycosyltransferase involved in cell wall biosynthesis
VSATSGASERDDAPSICFVTTDFVSVIRNGGIGTHFWLMSRLLAKRGWDVHVLFCGDVDDEEAMASMPARMAAEGVSFAWLEELPAPAWKGIPIYADSMHNLILSQSALEALERLHAEHSFDVIEFQDWRALGFRSAQAKRSGLAFDDVALAVKLHSTTDWQRRGNLAPRDSVWELKVEWCERYAFERADLQLSPSRYMAEDTRSAGWDVREDVVVAYPFPDPEPTPTAQDATLRKLAFFGRLERRKGLDIFLDALETLPREIPVAFIGRDTTMDGRSAKEIIVERLGDRPHEIEDELDREAALAKLSRGDALAVIASQTETFGFTVAECIANRIPFVAANAGGIPEVLRHPEARERWLFEPTPRGLSAAIAERLAADADEEQRLRREASEACDSERWNDEVEAKYRQAVARFHGRQSPASPAQSATATVSVAVAHYNHAAFLPAALDSIAKQARQPDEVFVIDDGSTDPDALAVFDDMKARYPEWTFLRQDNAGPGAARNRCLELADGTYFLPFDSDNIARPELIETLVTAMRADPSRDVATCQALAFTEEEDIANESFAFRFGPTGGPRILSPRENVFGDTCALFRSEALRAVGGFETDRLSHEDWETMAKLAFAGYDVDVVPRTLFWYRSSTGSRRDTLTDDPANEFRLRKKMVEDLVDVELDRDERIALWECLTAFTAPNSKLVFLQQAHDDAAEWGVGLAERAAACEQRLNETVARHQHNLAIGDPATLAQVPVRRLWPLTIRKTVGALVRRAKTMASRLWRSSK